MYPNPQEALPILPRASVERYQQLADALVHACGSPDPEALRAWAAEWLAALRAEGQRPEAFPGGARIDASAEQVERFAREALSRGGGSPAEAQYVLARVHGFASWPVFVDHVESLRLPGSPIGTFEAAATAVVSGEITTVRRLLGEYPDVVRARSTREHRGTLLHYVSANGVEGYRQLTPKNIVAITEALLAAGAEVDAEAEVYGDRCTTLGLVATSAPPAIAGVQRDLIDLLVDHGARMDRPGIAGNRHALVHACLANGQPGAAAHLVSRGAPLDLAGAAGIGRLEDVERFFTPAGELTRGATRAQLVEGFALACAYGRPHIVGFLLDRGVNVDAELRVRGEGHTALHAASYHGHLEIVRTLLERGARVDAIDRTWGTPPLIWALTGWSRTSAREPEAYYGVVSHLVAAGAEVTRELLDWARARGDARMLETLSGPPRAG